MQTNEVEMSIYEYVSVLLTSLADSDDFESFLEVKKAKAERLLALRDKYPDPKDSAYMISHKKETW